MTDMQAFRQWAQERRLSLAAASRDTVQKNPIAIFESEVTDLAWVAFLAGWRACNAERTGDEHG